MKPYSPSEHQIQASYIAWLNLQYPVQSDYCFAIPNGGSRPKKTYITRFGNTKTFCPSGKKLKAEGVKAGLPDIIIFVPKWNEDGSCFHALMIEFKSAKGRLSKEQKDVCQKLKNKDYFVIVAYNLEEAIEATIGYLGLP